MGWVPYPAHMGPRFAGPITALRAFKKKKGNNRAYQPSRLTEQFRPETVQTRRECAAMSAPAPPSYLPPHEVNQAKINRAEDPGQN